MINYIFSSFNYVLRLSYISVKIYFKAFFLLRNMCFEIGKPFSICKEVLKNEALFQNTHGFCIWIIYTWRPFAFDKVELIRVESLK